MVRVWHDTTRTKTSQNFSWEKKCVFVWTQREKGDYDNLCIGENSTGVCSASCLSIIVSSCCYCEMFVCDHGVCMSHQPLRPKVRSEGSDAHGKNHPPPNKQLFPSYSSASSPLLLSCSFVSQWRNETSTTSTSLPLLLVSVQALFPLVIFWAPCTFPRNLCIHFLCCCAGWTSSVWEQLKSSHFFMFKSPSNKGLWLLQWWELQDKRFLSLHLVHSLSYGAASFLPSEQRQG